jgi:DNA-binding response OmpR family regulator
MSDRILVAEKDVHLRESICLHLELEGYHCEPAVDGRSARELLAADRFDLLLIDLNLSGIDGLNVCRLVATSLPRLRPPVLLLTPASRRQEALLALEEFADDYLVQPVGLRELVARSRALMRRSRSFGVQDRLAPEADPTIVRRGLMIDPARRRVQVNRRDVALTDHEFRLLYALCARPGVVFTRQALLTSVWGADTFVSIRSVDTLVKRLRRRLDAVSSAPSPLVTVHGVGYKFDDVVGAPVAVTPALAATVEHSS